MRNTTRHVITQFAICNLQFAILFALTATASQSALPRLAQADWPWSGMFGDPPAAGTAAWWKKHKSEAVFEVGKGYKVPNVEGYFDQDGRPMDGPVARERIVKATTIDADAEDGLMPALDPKVQYQWVKTAVGLGPNEQYARGAYVRGVDAFQAKNYSAAAKEFADAVDRGVNTNFHQDAMFMLAESYFFDDRYVKARDAYDALVAKYSNTRYLDTLIEREWNIARYWEKYEDYDSDWALTPNGMDKTRPVFDTIGHAIKTYDNIRLNDPTGPRADDAIMATAGIYYRRRKYEEADYHYTLLRREYPKSEFQFEAHILGLQAKLNKYQGPDYDGTPIEEADKLVKQIKRQFAGRLSPEDRQRLGIVEAQLRQDIAMRDYRMAEHFDGTKNYGSAKIYYARVIHSFPDTDLAARARERVAELAGEPDEPPQRLGWLLEMVPQSPEKARLAKIPEIREGKTRLAQAASTSSGQTEGAVPTSATTTR